MTPADARSGSTVGKYRLHEIVGRGGMGVVYRAEHVYIGREVAVKILHEGYGGREESIKRFLREARAASLINHPNIVEVTDFGKANDGTVFFVMELLVGEPLDNILARDRRLDLLRSITICNQLAAALAAAHSKGIIHRDLKPENVMLIPREGRRELVRRVADESGAFELSEREQKFDFVKILDFGVAKVRESEASKGRVTKAGVVFGTPEYMAPETARIGFSDARSDIYALGVMFYEMLTGTVPFTGDAPVDVMLKQVNERVPPMRQVAPDAEITEDSERMILKALAKDPEQRHQSMEEFHRDLQKCYGQLRFRRILKTPAISDATPHSIAIPLTKKKKREPGSIPGGINLGDAISVEVNVDFQTDAGATRATTSTTPGSARGNGGPILLTKKKGQRSGDDTFDPIALQHTPPPVAETRRPTPPAGEPAKEVLRPAGEQPEPSGEQLEKKKKRTTLPLGHAPNGWTNSRPAAAASAAPVPPPLPTHGSDIGGVLITVPPRPKVAVADPWSDGPTPRVAITRDLVDDAMRTGHRDDKPWRDKPTLPGVKRG